MIPELPARWIRQFVWTSLICLFVFFLFTGMKFTKNHVIQEVIYTIHHLEGGHDLITREQVREKIFTVFEIDFTGVEVASLEMEFVENVLVEEPFIKQAHVYCDSRHNLHIEIFQRTPVMRVFSTTDGGYYIDDEGFKMPLSQNFTARVPVVTGMIPSYSHVDSAAHEHVVFRLLDVVEMMEGDPFLEAYLESMYIDQKQELTIIPKLGDHSILVGEVDDIK